MPEADSVQRFPIDQKQHRALDTRVNLELLSWVIKRHNTVDIYLTVLFPWF